MLVLESALSENKIFPINLEFGYYGQLLISYNDFVKGHFCKLALPFGPLLKNCSVIFYCNGIWEKPDSIF